MVRKMIMTSCLTGLLFGAASQAMAHFSMVIPSDNIVTQQKKSIDLTLSFSHPFEIVGMELVKPEKFYVTKDGKKTDLLGSLKESKTMGHKAWHTTYGVKRPGLYHFAMEPKPYWEPA